MNRTWLVLVVLPAFFLLSPVPGASASDCGLCVERKAKMCAQECRTVHPSRSRDCQNDCVKEYCSHRCPANDPDLENFLRRDCEACLEQQFNLCDANCPAGTDRSRAICKLECSNEHCADLCREKEAPEASAEPSPEPPAAASPGGKEAGQ